MPDPAAVGSCFRRKDERMGMTVCGKGGGGNDGAGQAGRGGAPTGNWWRGKG